MKHIVLPILVSFLLVGCETTFTGDAQINENIIVNNKKQIKKKRGGLLGRLGVKKKVWVNEQAELKSGSYQGKIEIDSKKMELKLHGAGPKLVFLMNDKIKKKVRKNSFVLPGSLTGQTFNMIGNNSTEYERGPGLSEFQSCTIKKVRTICERVCEQVIIEPAQDTTVVVVKDGKDGKKKKKKKKKKGPKTKMVCKKVCKDHIKYIDGKKLVHFHYLTTINILSVKFESNGEVIADFLGDNKSVSRITDSVSKCRRHRHWSHY